MGNPCPKRISNNYWIKLRIWWSMIRIHLPSKQAIWSEWLLQNKSPYKLSICNLEIIHCYCEDFPQSILNASRYFQLHHRFHAGWSIGSRTKRKHVILTTDADILMSSYLTNGMNLPAFSPLYFFVDLRMKYPAAIHMTAINRPRRIIFSIFSAFPL